VTYVGLLEEADMTDTARNRITRRLCETNALRIGK